MREIFSQLSSLLRKLWTIFRTFYGPFKRPVICNNEQIFFSSIVADAFDNRIRTFRSLPSFAHKIALLATGAVIPLG